MTWFRGGWGRLLALQCIASLVIGLGATGVWLAGRPQEFWPRWVWFGLTLNLLVQYAARWALRRPTGRRGLTLHAVLTAVYVPMDVTIWALAGGGFFYPVFSITAVLIALAVHVWWLRRTPTREQALIDRVDVLARTRSGALDVQAAELKRIERDLHDGAQARMVSLAMNLGLASELLSTDPAAVADLLAEARSTTLSALGELRTVMEGIQPPVLADRGLAGAVQALALDLALPVTVTVGLQGVLDPAVESAVYFAVAEALANVLKHSGATAATVSLEHQAGLLRAIIGDNGTGGATMTAGSGLPGIASRLEVFDGIVTVISPVGGPTHVIVEVPCALSSSKTSPSSATA